jgi:hypothetical protein
MGKENWRVIVTIIKEPHFKPRFPNTKNITPKADTHQSTSPPQ